MKENEIKTPFYIVYEDRLRANLELISRVARQADVKIIMAFKANALWRTFPIIREYGVDATASSLNELRLAQGELSTPESTAIARHILLTPSANILTAALT